MEELLVKKIECGIRGIRLGTKNPNEVMLGKSLERLKDINEGLKRIKPSEYLFSVWKGSSVYLRPVYSSLQFSIRDDRRSICKSRDLYQSLHISTWDVSA